MRRLLPLLLGALCLLGFAVLLDPRLPEPLGRLDRDGDGRLAPDEAPPVLARAFPAVDGDGSGLLEGRELRLWTLERALGGATRPVPVPTPPARVDAAALRAWLEAPVRDGSLDGVGLLLLDAGTVVFRHAAGELGASTPVPVAEAGAWLAAATVACAAERAAVPLETPLGRWLPELPGAWGRATLAQLLSHSAGAPARRDAGFASDVSLDAAVRALAARYPAAPGSRFEPASPGPELAARAMELESGRSWRRLFVECLAWPLSMEGAAWGGARGAPARQGRVDPARGLHLSLEDYGRFLSLLQQGGRYGGVANLRPATVEALETVRTEGLPRGEETAGREYALGVWCVRRDGARCRRLERPGGWGTLAWLDRDTGRAGVLLLVDSAPRVSSWARATQALAERFEAGAGG
jgi:CubicO group peptidase (beta-lactamase class C family)